MAQKTNKQAAIEAGQKFYQSEKPCKRGHTSLRRVSTNDCVDCSRERQSDPSVKAYKASYYKANKQKILDAAKINYRKSSSAKIAYASDYQKRNIKKICARREEAFKLKAEKLPWILIKRRARSSCSAALRRVGSMAKFRTLKILGCDAVTLQKHIERQFLTGMNWENRHLWHVDHIVPLASAKNEADVIALCHYTNLRPLWANENIKKSDKMEFLI